MKGRVAFFFVSSLVSAAWGQAPEKDVEDAEPAPAASAAPAAPKMPPGAASPAKIETPNSSFKLGVLLQPQFESAGVANTGMVGDGVVQRGMSNNFFVRRVRLLFGGTLFEDLEFFVDTDYPDLFKAVPGGTPENPTYLKNTPGMNVQDAQGTLKLAGDALKVDAGYMLPPLSHNALQSAASLYSWDYFANSFRHNTSFGSSGNPVGRDLGVQLRGLLADGLVEYRAGLFQGLREAPTATEVGSQNSFRVAARLQLNLLDAEAGFFYGGTYLGTKRIASLGVSYDFQDSYKHISGDAFLDMEVGQGVLTAQVNVVHWNGNEWIVSLPEQTAVMGEAGYLFYAARLSPIVRYERRWVTTPTAVVPDETRIGGGVAFWPYAHNFNLKAFYTRVEPEPAEQAFNQINVQAQFFLF